MNCIRLFLIITIFLCLALNGQEPNDRHIYQQTLRALGITSPTQMDMWELLTELKKKKIVEEYALYQEDKSISSNVGTVPIVWNKRS